MVTLATMWAIAFGTAMIGFAIGVLVTERRDPSPRSARNTFIVALATGVFIIVVTTLMRPAPIAGASPDEPGPLRTPSRSSSS